MAGGDPGSDFVRGFSEDTTQNDSRMRTYTSSLNHSHCETFHVELLPLRLCRKPQSWWVRRHRIPRFVFGVVVIRSIKYLSVLVVMSCLRITPGKRSVLLGLFPYLVYRVSHSSSPLLHDPLLFDVLWIMTSCRHLGRHSATFLWSMLAMQSSICLESCTPLDGRSSTACILHRSVISRRILLSTF